MIAKCAMVFLSVILLSSPCAASQENGPAKLELTYKRDNAYRSALAEGRYEMCSEKHFESLKKQFVIYHREITHINTLAHDMDIYMQMVENTYRACAWMKSYPNVPLNTKISG